MTVPVKKPYEKSLSYDLQCICFSTGRVNGLPLGLFLCHDKLNIGLNATTHHGPLDGRRQSLWPDQKPVGGSPSLGTGRRAGGGHCLHRQHRHLLNTTYSCTDTDSYALTSQWFTINSSGQRLCLAMPAALQWPVVRRTCRTTECAHHVGHNSSTSGRRVHTCLSACAPCLLVDLLL